MLEGLHSQNPFLFEKYCTHMGALGTIQFFYGECVNLKSSQQQMQFIKYSKFFRRAIAVICI